MGKLWELLYALKNCNIIAEYEQIAIKFLIRIDTTKDHIFHDGTALMEAKERVRRERKVEGI
jgi:hypothetical protein